VDDQQRSYEELLEENLRLKAWVDSQMSGKISDPGKMTYQGVHQEVEHRRSLLLKTYALDLACISYQELYSFIISKVFELFSVKLAFISIFDPKKSELKVKYSSLSGADSLTFEKLIGCKITALNIPVSEEQYHYINSEPFRHINSLHELSFGVIPEAAGQLAETALDLGWFIGLGLIHKEKLVGTIVLIGSKTELQPEKEDLSFFSGITANAIGRMVAEEALDESETRFKQLFDEAPVSYQSLTKEGRFLDINPEWLNTFGYKKEDVLGRHISDFITQKSREVFSQKFKTFGKKGVVNYELEMIAKDGNILNIEMVGKIGYTQNGDFRQTHCILKDVTSQRKAEELMREREEVFEAIANYTANWEAWFDANGKIIWTNPASFKFTGYSPAEIIALPDYIDAFVAEHDRERVSAILREALAGKESSSVEFTCIRKDNTTFRISVTWNHIRNKQGKALGIRTSGQDITSHRMAEEAVSYSEGLYKQMIDNAPFGMHFYQVDDQGHLIFTGANPAADKILGIDHAHFIGHTIEQAFPSLVGTEVVGHYREAALHNKTWVNDQIIYADNRFSGAYEVKAFQTVPGRMVALFTDITKRKQAEKDLKENQQLFEALARVSPVGIFRTDINGETTFVNPKWTSLTGLSFNDAMESRYLTAIHPDDREERVAEWREAVKEGKMVVSEYRFLRPDGSIVWVQGNAVPEIADGKLKGHIGTITDISDLKKAEIELLKAKEKAEASNRLKTTFMGNISHEIRTPLNGIIGFAELISSGSNSAEENDECIEFLNHSINRLTKIIDNIMDVSMMMSGNTTIKHETFSIDELIGEIYKKYELQAARKSLEISIVKESDNTGKTIQSDKSLLNRIISELVDNAIKFSNKGNVVISYKLIDNLLALSVSDKGIGISNDFLPFIFEPFIQEDVYSARVNNSNGLGLSIVHEAINILGGRVAAESTPGAGTRISVDIPVVETEINAAEGLKSPSGDIPGKSPVIMIVEDEEINMIYLKRLLSQKGYRLLLATNAPEAIAMIEQGTSVDLILMDMKMPGMDGFEATRKIKALSPGIRIAAVTAYASDSDRDSCFEAGCEEYIAKPFQKNDLYQLLNRMGF
jgi:PAS domain S-box-containing protein